MKLRKILYLVVLCLWSIGAYGAEVQAESLALTLEQSEKLAKMQEQLKAEVQPIWEEVESGREHIIEIEKKYFQEFWGMLSEEQKLKFADLQR